MSKCFLCEEEINKLDEFYIIKNIICCVPCFKRINTSKESVIHVNELHIEYNR